MCERGDWRSWSIFAHKKTAVGTMICRSALACEGGISVRASDAFLVARRTHSRLCCKYNTLAIYCVRWDCPRRARVSCVDYLRRSGRGVIDIPIREMKSRRGRDPAGSAGSDFYGLAWNIQGVKMLGGTEIFPSTAPSLSELLKESRVGRAFRSGPVGSRCIYVCTLVVWCDGICCALWWLE